MHGSEPQVRRDSLLFEEFCSTLLSRGHAVEFQVHGQSMQPNLFDGDTVVVAPVSVGGLRRGDIVLAEHSDGLCVHRFVSCDSATGEVILRSDTGHDFDPRSARVFGKVLARRRGSQKQYFLPLQTRFVHPVRVFVRRVRLAAQNRLRRLAFALCAMVSLLLVSATFLGSAADAQTADLQLTQTPSASAVATNATTQSLGTAGSVTWTGGVATFTFPAPLPSGVFANALLTTTGFTPAAYNLTNTSLTSVNYATGAVTVALTNQSMGTATAASWASGLISFTFPTPLPSFAVVGAQLTTAGFTPTAYNVTNATITSVNGGTGVVTVALAAQSLGTATAASWASGGGGHASYTFPVPLPSYAVVGGLLTTTGFTPAGYNVTNATITSVNAGSGVIQVAMGTNPGASTVRGLGTVGPATSSVRGTGSVNPTSATTNGTGTVPAGYTYSEVVTNNSSSATVTSGTITVYMQTPANTVFESYSGTNWTCTAPTAGSTGPIVCTYHTTLASGATASALTLGFQIVAGTAAGTTIQSSATVTNSTFVDTVPSNNTSISSIVVEPATSSDLSLSMSVSPTPVFISSTLTYSIQVQNYGQASAPASSNILTDVLPSGATGVTFASISVPSGWSCTTPAVGSSGTVSCSITSPMPALPAAGSTATIAITVNAPSTATTLNNSATVSLSGDPNSANNSATAYTVVQPLACASPGRDGAGGTLTGVINAYFPPSSTGTLASASTSVALGAASGASTPIAIGDLLLIIQMQGASINSTNTSSYGDGLPGDPASGSTSAGSSGLFEFVTATNAVPVTGGTLQFTGTGPTGGLLNSYSRVVASTTQAQQTYQVIRVPQYASATLSSGLVPLAWTGSVGGVLAFDVSSQLTLSGTVSLDTLGFRGGGAQMLVGPSVGGTNTPTDYVTGAPTSATTTVGANGSKGEGIAGTPRYIAPATITTTSTPTDVYGGTLADSLPTGSYARGAPGNAGGGGTDGHPAGNDYNSGGGAGANGGAGGQGGYGWNSMAATNTTDGGFGGAAFAASTSALVMGGGGGAGTTNNGTGTCTTSGNGTGIYSSGGYGGGIVIVHAGSVTGTGTITANGESTLSTLNDSTGGGGAGGSILIFANSGGLSGLTASANGGNGGYAWPTSAPGGFPGQRHGPGGGGGGGVIFLTATPASATVFGGLNGYTNTVQDSYGATAGSAGVLALAHVITETPGTQSGAYCGSADLSVTNSGSPSVVLPGGNITYTQLVRNAGPLDAVNAVFSESIPANTTFQSINSVAGWTCVTPAVGATGTVTCTNPNFANAATVTFTPVVQVVVGTPAGTQIVDVDNITSGTNDPNLANNTATAVTTVGSVTQADLAVTNTASSPAVIAGSNVTMTAVVTNNGPATATGNVFTETIPVNTTLGAVLTPPSGWTCNAIPVGGTGTFTCTNSSFAALATSTFTIVLNVNAGTASGTVISDEADIASATPDPNSGNNSATATTVVATAGQVDLAISASGLPNPVTPNNNITYTQTVTNNGPIAITASGATTVTFTDAIPANTTLGSAFTAPTGWTCNSISVGGTGTFTCTLNSGQTLAVGATVNFPLVVKVNAATASGTTITNSPSIASSVSDPTLANNTATVTTAVASPTQADVSITKTASPEPVNQGTNLAYTLMITNGGPAIAQNVVVTDALPAQVTYSSSFTTMGSCSYDAPTTTVTCNLGDLSVGSTAVVTINVTAVTFSSSSYSTNTATVSSSTSDPNLANNTSSFTSTIQAPTAVDLSSFRTFQQPDGSVRLVWRTHEESRNLGFHIYREDGAGHHRLDSALIAGSALLLRGSRPQHAAKSYGWIDSQPSPDAAYWVEDVDINGTRSLHGPAYPETVSETQLASQAVAQALAVPVSPSLRQLHANALSATSAARRLMTPMPVFPAPSPSLPRFNTADHVAVKVSVDHEGWYHVPFAQLFSAGLDPRTDLQSLRLYAEGIEQPLLLVGHSSGVAAPTDALEFYGTGIDTPFSDTRVYWLVRDGFYPKRILPIPAPASGGAAPASFPFTVIRQDRTVYFAALLNGENNDNFFGAVISSDPVDQTLTVANRDTSSSQPLTLDLTLQGAADGQQHSVSVQFNGSTVGTFDFYGFALAKQSFSVDPSLVQDGANTVTLTALNGDNDVSVVQSIALHYLHTYTADADWLRATANSGSEVRISGFANAQIRVFDVTNPLNISQLDGRITQESGAFAVSVALPNGAPSVHTLLAFSVDAESSPSALEHHVPAFLDDKHTGADIVIVTHPDFTAHLAPLVRLRESQGYRVSLVTTSQLFDEFNYGERSPFAIRSFLQDAVAHWHRKPQAVLLVGDASQDPRNYLGFGDFDFVPTRIIETAAFKTASDDWFSDFQHNGYPTIPTGRLPVRTTADVDLVVSKIINYEQGQSAGSWDSQALLIADQNIDSNFTSAVSSAAAALPRSLQVSQILANGRDPATVRSQILSALNNGALLVNYNGHGAEQQWSFSDLFNNNDASALTNGNQLPVYLLIDCLNGLFQDVYAQSLAESLLLAPNGGAVAVWASSGFTDQAPQASMNLAFLHQLAAHPHDSLGRLILHAKAGTTDNDVRRTWILFGDPAMKFRLSVSSHNSSSDSTTTGDTQPNCSPRALCIKEIQLP
jgi:uncharacterized repeat protein (TIGR01451 family)